MCALCPFGANHKQPGQSAFRNWRAPSAGPWSVLECCGAGAVAVCRDLVHFTAGSLGHFLAHSHPVHRPLLLNPHARSLLRDRCSGRRVKCLQLVRLASPGGPSRAWTRIRPSCLRVWAPCDGHALGVDVDPSKACAVGPDWPGHYGLMSGAYPGCKSFVPLLTRHTVLKAPSLDRAAMERQSEVMQQMTGHRAFAASPSRPSTGSASRRPGPIPAIPGSGRCSTGSMPGPQRGPLRPLMPRAPGSGQLATTNQAPSALNAPQPLALSALQRQWSGSSAASGASGPQAVNSLPHMGSVRPLSGPFPGEAACAE